MKAQTITFIIFIIILIIVIKYPSKNENFKQEKKHEMNELQKDLLKGTHDIAKYFIMNN